MTDNTDQMRRAVLLGYPVSHALSPTLHSYWLQQYGINGHYGAMAVLPGHLKQALDMLRNRGDAGCNLTIPHKEDAMALMDDHDESAVMSGAVNTVVIRDGKLIGYNSDGFGFVEGLKAAAPDFAGQRVAVLGCGGASRGIIASLRGAMGVKSFALINRTRAKAERIIKQFTLHNSEVFEWHERDKALAGCDLLVNCTSLGLVGEDHLEISLDALPAHAVVADIVYRPYETPLLAAARLRGHIGVDGLAMLMHQGRLGFEHWFGVDPVVDDTLKLHLLEKMESESL